MRVEQRSPHRTAFATLVKQHGDIIPKVAAQFHRNHQHIPEAVFVAAIEQYLYESVPDIIRAEMRDRNIAGYVRTLARNAALKRLREES